MPDDPKDSVRSQFDRRAAWYAISGIHRQSEGLEELLRLAAPTASDRALDVATGTGFTALALAPRCRRVVGLDMTAGMVREACALRSSRGVSNLEFCLGDAEAIPFVSGAFDLVTCRHAAHHFPHLARAAAEMARVTRPGGRIVLADTCAPEPDHLAALMNAWEVRRDPSHVVCRPPSRLRVLFREQGLRVDAAVMTQVPLEFDDWVRRAGVPSDEAAALRIEFLGAPPDARAAFRIRRDSADVHFAWDELVLLCTRSSGRGSPG